MDATFPDGLADLPPGPRLAVVLGAVELSTVPNDRMLDVLAAQYRQLSHEQARMAAVLAEVGRCAGDPEPAVARLDAPDRYAPDETRAALRWTRRAAEWEHDLAETVVHALPELHAAWLAGQVDRPRVLVFDRYLAGLNVEQCSAICAAAVPRAPRLTTGQLAVLLRRMVLAVDPDAAERWYRKGLRERNVTAVMDVDGTVTMSANGLPADDAEAACTRVQDLAATAQRAGHPGRIGQIRCDLFLGLLDGRFHGLTPAQIVTMLIAAYRADDGASEDGAPTTDGSAPDADPAARPAHGTADRDGADSNPNDSNPNDSSSGSSDDATDEPGNRPSDTGIDSAGDPATTSAARGRSDAGPSGDARTGIEVRVALSTLLGRDDQPGEIPGLGLLPATAARARVALQRRAEWRFAVTDTDGTLLSEGTTRRRPATVGPFPVGRGGVPGGIVEVHVPATLLAELIADPTAAGPWAAVLADIAAQHARRHDHLADLDARPTDRLPGAALRRHTEIRDRTCVFPGCRRRAHATDQDHTRAHAHGGPTVRVNTAPVCGHDHDVKHRAGWRLHQPEPGRFVWHSPLGGRYATRGEFLLPPMPGLVPGDPGPDLTSTGRYDEGPILGPRRPVPPRPPPLPAPALPDEPPF